MLDAEGRIFNIQKFSIHDGPGIRTVVFFPVVMVYNCFVSLIETRLA